MAEREQERAGTASAEKTVDKKGYGFAEVGCAVLQLCCDLLYCAVCCNNVVMRGAVLCVVVLGLDVLC